MTDNINHPSHYNNGKFEVIEIMQDKLSTEQFEGYLRANIIKYIFRYDKKNGLEDLKKCMVYMRWLVELKENGKIGVYEK